MKGYVFTTHLYNPEAVYESECVLVCARIHIGVLVSLLFLNLDDALGLISEAS